MLQWIAKCILKLGGWTAVGTPPTMDKAVLIAAPHTSNWDGLWGLVYKVSIGIEAHFFAKSALFWFPLGTLLRGLGGIPLNRGEPGSALKKAIDAFESRERFYFALAPEGTRSRRAHWKSGFYRIAEGAGVPVCLGFFDYGKKHIGFGPTIELSGDTKADLAKIQAFYDTVEGRWPEKASPAVFPGKL